MKERIFNQFCENNSKIDEPEQELYLAILFRAIMDYHNYFEAQPTQVALGKIKRSLVSWFSDWQTGNNEYVSFFDCCHAISETPNDLRQIIRTALITNFNFKGRGHHQKYKTSAIT